jgi:Zn-dependent protease
MFQVMALSAVDPALQYGALILGLAIAIILHEVAHGLAALKLGDPTAKYAGRLTLNPIKHIDLWGTIIVPLIMLPTGFVFGWAKPVPVNYYNLRYGKYGPLIVAVAGPAMNLFLMAFFGLMVRLAPVGTALPVLFFNIALVNGLLMLFNLLPVPPLDGSKVLYVFLERRPDIIQWMERYGFIILLGIIFFGQGLLRVWIGVPLSLLIQIFTGL